MVGRWILVLSCALAFGASALAPAQLQSVLYVSGLSLPVAMVQDPTMPNVQYVVQQRGRIRIIQNGVLLGTDFLDLTGIASTSGSERGLLGLAFHPNYAQNRFIYVNYTDVPSPGNTRIVRYTRNAVNPLLVDPGSAFPILTIPQPFTNHNGGSLRFGPFDGYLYIGMGDGGSGNDPGNRAQTITNMLLGKMLRIDIDGDDFPADPNRNYRIPPNNPFVGVVGDDEIWSCGLRNPWKFTFDNPMHLGNGAMLIGDVGQNAWEEIDYEPPLRGGRNYGWRVREGYAVTGLGGWNGIPMTDPIWAYPRGASGSVTGGYVYRGTLLGDFFGRYFFADYVQSRIWSLKITLDANGEALNVPAADVTEHTADLGIVAGGLSSIDVDANGELYYIDYGNGRIFRIMPENRCWITGVETEHMGPMFGQVRSLSATDNMFLGTLPQELFDLPDQFLSIVYARCMTNMAAPNFFDVFVDVRHNEIFSNGTLRIGLFNWGTNLYDDFGTFSITQALGTKQVLSIPAGPYRRADGRVDVRLYAFNNGTVSADGYLVEYDRLKVVPR